MTGTQILDTLAVKLDHRKVAPRLDKKTGKHTRSRPYLYYR